MFWLRACLVVVLVALTAPAWAQSKPSQPKTPKPKTPKVDVVSGDGPEDFGVDIVTQAGEDTGPPKRAASFTTDAPEEKVRWNPAWKKFTLGNYVHTGVMLAATLGSLAIPSAADRWRQTNSFDVSARNALRLNTLSGRRTARDASDIMLVVGTNLLLVDTMIVTWWGHGEGDVAWEMALMSVEALAFNNAINGLVSALSSRQRPYGLDDCTTENDDDDPLLDCRTSKRYRSFFSGHSSTTFAVAGLTCMHHAHLPLYGGGLPDILACASAFGVAASTATLRVVADQHWTSDVLVGAAWGTFSGLFIPWVLHYRTGDLPDGPDLDGVSMQLIPTPTGANLTGVF